MSKFDDDLLQEGIFHARVKEYDVARGYLVRAYDNADDLETRLKAAYWLSVVTDDPTEKRKYLEDVLSIDINHIQARRALAILDGKLKPEEIIDPDRIQPQAGGTRAVSADRFTCPNCGGRMGFAADGQTLECEFCLSGQQLGQQRSAEQDFLINMAKAAGHHAPTATQVFKCGGCGADFILPPQTLSVPCAFCGSNHVVRQKGARDLISPDAIIPMAFGREQAAWRLVHWVEQNHIQPLGKVQAPAATYLPVWLFEAGGDIPWSGFTYRNKQRIPVSGRQGVLYGALAVPGTRTMGRLMQRVLPEFHFDQAVAYDPRFLAGWAAEVYAISLSDAALEARRMAVERVRQDITVLNGEVMELRHTPTKIALQSFQLVLVPVWLTEVRMEKMRTRVVINGQTGAVHGELPERGWLDWLGDLIGVD